MYLSSICDGRAVHSSGALDVSCFGSFIADWLSVIVISTLQRYRFVSCSRCDFNTEIESKETEAHTRKRAGSVAVATHARPRSMVHQDPPPSPFPPPPRTHTRVPNDSSRGFSAKPSCYSPSQDPSRQSRVTMSGTSPSPFHPVRPPFRYF